MRHRSSRRPLRTQPRHHSARSETYLGKQTVEGLETVGARETTVIPPGAIGNDSPIDVQREYWYAPQLGINLISKLDDPRVGTQNFELSDVRLGEPDKKLFKISREMKLIDLRK